MKTKRGLIILMTFLVAVILVGCSSQSAVQGPGTQVVPSQSAAPSAFVSSLPSVRDSVANAYASINIFLEETLTNFGGNQIMSTVSPTIVSGIKSKAKALEETVNSIELIISDFNSNKARVEDPLISEIDTKLTVYTNNKNKLLGCSNELKKYSDFVDLTIQRETSIKGYTEKMNSASQIIESIDQAEQDGKTVDSSRYDQIIALYQQARVDIAAIKSSDTARNSMGIVSIGTDALKSWDIHLEAMDLLIGHWNALKIRDIKLATEKAAQHQKTFTTANKYGATEPKPEEQVKMIDVWLTQNIGVCKGILQ